MPKRNKKCKKGPKVPKKMQHVWTFFASFLKHIQIFFVTVTQCNKQKNCLLQWLSATNKTNLCHSYPVQPTILKKLSNFFVPCDKQIGKKAKNKQPFKFEFHHRYQIALGYLKLEYAGIGWHRQEQAWKGWKLLE